MVTVPALSDEAAINQYVASSAQTDFNFTYMIFATADIKVYVDGVLKTEITDYNVRKSTGASITSSDLPLDGGKVVFTSGLTLDAEVTLSRSIAVARLTGYSVAGAFRADVLNAELTKIVAICQELKRDSARSITLAPYDSEGGSLVIPSGRAGNFLAFDASGNMITAAGTTETTVSTFAATLLDDATDSAARATLGLTIGTNVQAWDAQLDSLAALTSVSTLVSLAALSIGAANGNIPVVGTSSATETLAGLALLPTSIVITNNTTDANNDIDFTGGVFQFSDGSGQAVAASRIKRLDASWVAGTNQGGLDTGTKANSTWYYCYAIYNPTTSVVDFLFSASPTSPTLPSGFTKSYRIKGAFVKTNSSGNIIPFYHLGRTWTNRTSTYADQLLVAQTSQVGSTATLSSAFPALENRAMTEIEMATASAGSSSFSVWGNLQSTPGTGSPTDATNLRSTSITTNNGFGVSGIGQVFNNNGVLSYRNWESAGGVSAIKVFLISIEDLTK